MDRSEIAHILRNIATLLELKGENPFKTRAYNNGAEIVETFSGDLVQRAKDNQLKDIKGLGDALQQKIHELASTGKLEFYENLRADFPAGIFELFEIQGLGPKKIKAVYEAFNVGSVAELKTVCESGAVTALAGFGQKSVDKILEAIAFRESNSARFRLDQVAVHVHAILDFLKGHPDVSRAEVAGSYRRAKETVGDLDFIVATKHPATVCADFARSPFAERVIVQGDTKTSINLSNGAQVDLRAVSNAEFPFALNYFTGSKEHNVAMRSRALKRGYTLNEYRLAPTGSEPEPTHIYEETHLYDFLGLAYVEPELRENTGEIEAAAAHDLPRLVEQMNLRGTFHNHTTASDGKNSLREMADAAFDLGLQYLGIADHSKSSFQANGLDEVRLRAQIEEIHKLNQEYDGFRILAGSEVDILKDGTLDFDDDLLSELDYVVASVHSAFTLSEDEMTARIIKAIENPHVTMIGHLTGRLLLKREPYAVNIPAIIDACARTGTILELNASPWRLDLDWRWWRMAKEKGVKCAINPDAHHTNGLQHLYHGVRTARKGWLERADVVNCLPLKEIESLLGC